MTRKSGSFTGWKRTHGASRWRTTFTKNIRVIGSFSGDVKSYWKALQFASAHIDHIPFRKMITGRFALADVNVALERMHALQEIKPLIVME